MSTSTRFSVCAWLASSGARWAHSSERCDGSGWVTSRLSGFRGSGPRCTLRAEPPWKTSSPSGRCSCARWPSSCCSPPTPSSSPPNSPWSLRAAPASTLALVASRRTRIDAMVRRGDRKAKTVQTALQDLYFQLSAVQLGITLASILLGYVAEETTAVLFREWFQAVPWPVAFVSRAALASVIAVSVISFLHVVVGEVAPKNLALTYPEQTSRWVAGPLLVFSWITRPATNLLNWSANSLVRVLGIKSAAAELER
ncbi:MAG: DUF21 domain-containing protein, partial [Gemmatimonadetes bacterium]|nr:DUF21 domain-containing protein [Gemmatimonadota bacterium]